MRAAEGAAVGEGGCEHVPGEALEDDHVTAWQPRGAVHRAAELPCVVAVGFFADGAVVLVEKGADFGCGDVAEELELDDCFVDFCVDTGWHDVGGGREE